MGQSETFKAAVEYFNQEPRVKVLSNYDYDEDASRIEAWNNPGEDYLTNLCIVQNLGDRAVCRFHENGGFMGGPVEVIFNEDGTRTELFWFQDEDGDARTLSGHEALQYRAAQLAAERGEQVAA